MVNGCTKYEQDPLNIVGYREVTRVEWKDRQTDSVRHNNSLGPEWAEGKYETKVRFYMTFCRQDILPYFSYKLFLHMISIKKTFFAKFFELSYPVDVISTFFLYCMVWHCPSICLSVYFMPLLPEASFAFKYFHCLHLSGCVCLCVYLCVNLEVALIITCHLFKIEPPDLNQKCKTPWLGSVFFCGMIDHDPLREIELKVKHLNHFELAHAITPH